MLGSVRDEAEDRAVLPHLLRPGPRGRLGPARGHGGAVTLRHGAGPGCPVQLRRREVLQAYLPAGVRRRPLPRRLLPLLQAPALSPLGSPRRVEIPSTRESNSPGPDASCNARSWI